MLDNTITLPVDLLNNGTTTDEEYTRYDDSTPNRSTYVAETHSVASRNTMTFYRTQPKRAGNFKGVARSAVKISEDFEVPGVDPATTVTAPAIIDIAFNYPVGVTAAQKRARRQRVIALLDDDALMDRLDDKLEV